MLNSVNKLENITICIGSVIGLSQIETVLGIVIMSFQLVLILYKFIHRLIENVKKKDFEGIETDLETTIEELEKLKKDGDSNGK